MEFRRLIVEVMLLADFHNWPRWQEPMVQDYSLGYFICDVGKFAPSCASLPLTQQVRQKYFAAKSYMACKLAMHWIIAK